MAAPDNVFMTIDHPGTGPSAAVGQREDLQDIIYMLDKQDHPFMTSIGTDSITAVNFDWQTDDVGTPQRNMKPEGDTRVADAAVPTVRPANTAQISSLQPQVSGTLDAVNTAGRAKESAYQDMLAGLRLANIIEMTISTNQPRKLTDARGTAGAESWISTNAQHEVAGATVGFDPADGTIDAPTDSTNAYKFEEPLYKNGINAAWQQGGNTNLHVMNITDKETFSAFDGNATRYRDMPRNTPGEIIAGADLYISNVGQHKVVASRYVRSVGVDFGDGTETHGCALLLDTRYWKLSYLRRIGREVLAKDGDSRKSLMLAEFGLRCGNEAASAKMADTSADTRP